MPVAADLLVRALDEAGVRVVFGLPGVRDLAALAALRESAIRLVGVRDEQTSVHAADGWARASGGVGVALVTPGADAAHAVGAIGEAWASGTPLLVIAADDDTLEHPGVGGEPLDEPAGRRAMFAPVTKRTFRVTDPAGLGRATAEALAAASAAPQRPVLLEVPAGVLGAEVGGDEPIAAGEAAYAETPDVDAALPLLLAAERPLVWAGGGALRAGAGPAVAALAERLGAPVLETCAARGLLAGNPHLLGLPPHLPEAVDLLDRADLVVAVGSDLDARDTMGRRLPQPRRLVAVNVDGTKHPRADAVVVADAVLGCEELLEGLDDAGHVPPGGGYASPACELPGFAAAWYGDLPGLRAAARRRLRAGYPEEMAFLDQVARVVPPGTTVVADRCAAGDWLAALHDVPAPRRLQCQMGWGTLGYALPAAIGAAAAGAPALAVCAGDGFLSACGELTTVRGEKLPLTLIVVVDEGGRGTPDRDRGHVGKASLDEGPPTPDHVALAAAFGVRAESVDGLGDAFGVALRRHLDEGQPSVLVARAVLTAPPTTTPAAGLRRERPVSDA